MHPMPSRGMRGKQRKEDFLFLFQPFSFMLLQQASDGSFPHSIWFTNTKVPYVLVLVSNARRQGTYPHRQAYWLLAKKTPSILLWKKVFLVTSASFR